MKTEAINCDEVYSIALRLAHNIHVIAQFFIVFDYLFELTRGKKL